MKHVWQRPGRFDGTDEVFTKEQVDELVKGLKTNNTALLGEKKALQEQFSTLQQKVAAFDGLDPAQIREMMSRFENDEEARLIKDGKISEVVNARAAKAIEAAERKVAEATAAAAAAAQRAEKFSQKVLDDSLRAAAIKSGVHKHAVDDVLLSGRNIFRLDNDGNAIRMEGDNVVLGADGKTPFGPDEWMGGLKDTKPHWFPASANSGSSTSDGSGGGGGKTMKRSQFMNLSPMEQAKAVKEVRIVD